MRAQTELVGQQSVDLKKKFPHMKTLFQVSSVSHFVSFPGIVVLF